ncbi:hypothetical protein EYB53_001525 [Candidatus Chloroploca sp. M-50]|uniref:Uncharacterized protein n=1 Tax=Candidatus Chloroploca mongolica TaxID=2528176 RepID=A0ABS4D4M3_9CHLR|nr:hypothetical protein [Candidatus Chloroploca mongolica]MBP1464376.1 hypothetical protein [Candidatus Chloroploca mongolica]
MSSNVSNALARAARRAEQQPFFLASVLAAYRQANRLDDAALATLLDCQLADMLRLALCRRPATEQTQFMADVDQLAQRFNLRGDQLAMIIRQVDALAAIQQQVQVAYDGMGMLRAARDHEEPAAIDEEGQHG